MNRKWTEKEAYQWQACTGWLRGCNFIGSDCANRIDMWQSYKRDEHMATAERELKLCKDIGFNSVRLIIEYDVWAQEHDAFMETLEMYISLCDKYSQRVMIVLTTEAQLCRGDKYAPKPLGEQAYALGYHQGRLPLTAEQKALTPYHELERADIREKFLEMVREVVTKYRTDPRVVCWNVYNEPGITIGERSLKLLDTLFETVRALDPEQPLCADVWHKLENGEFTNAVDKKAFELSDVISWHSYQPYEQLVIQYEQLAALGRPVLLTEWLNRINHSEVREVYPLLQLMGIDCWCWGFVQGKTQTHEPWDSLWEQYEASNGQVSYDFTRWQHDLFRPNLRPYDPKEIELIKLYNKL